MLQNNGQTANRLLLWPTAPTLVTAQVLKTKQNKKTLVYGAYANDLESEIPGSTFSQRLSFKIRTLRRKLNVSLAPDDFHSSQ